MSKLQSGHVLTRSRKQSRLDEAESLSLNEELTQSGERVGWILNYIHLENFKSYENRTSIGPLHEFPFVSIVGPNGSGKSNLMDAISFVMGERTASLRVHRLDELIHGASIDKPIAKTASVSAVFIKTNADDVNNGQQEVTFTRRIRGAASEYSINRNVVTHQVYSEALRNLGINAKGKNFLVFQGAIESIALKNSKERTTLLEEICGSAAMKDGYEKAKTRVAEADKKLEASYSKKKVLLSEKKAAKMEVQEAKYYNDLLNETTAKETEIALFKLYYNRQESEILEIELENEQQSLMMYGRLKENIEKELEGKKKERKDLNQEIAREESQLQKMDKEKSKRTPKQIEINQKLKHLGKKLGNAEKSLKQANDNKRNYEQDLAQLRENLEDAESNLQEFIMRHEDKQGAEGHDITLRDSQLEEYFDLKQKAYDLTHKERLITDELEKQKRDRELVYNSLNREKVELDGKLDVAEHKIKQEKKLAQKSLGDIQEANDFLRAKEDEAQPLRAQIHSAEDNVNQLGQQLEQLSTEVEAAKADRYQVARRKRKQDVINRLQNHFVGVFDRVTNLCKVIHPKYQLAITKTVGNNMESIVVDTASTAKQCIQYLQEQTIDPEVFLPLDLLHVKPLRESLRQLKKINPDICLAFDVLQIHNKAVELAILHCTKSTVICPTSEIASKVAAGEFSETAANAVSLKGTMYYSNGTLSGGMAGLRKKSLKWNDSQINEKEDQKGRIQEEMRECFKVLRNKMNLESLEHEIIAIKEQLKYYNECYIEHDNRTKELETERDQIKHEWKTVENRWTNAKTAVTEVAAQLTEYSKKINVTEDKVFLDFCRQIGIPNIRAYEENDVRAQEEFKREKHELENKIEEIKLQLNDEESQQHTCDENVKRWVKIVTDIKKDIEACKIEENAIKEEMTGIDQKLVQLREKLDELKHNLSLKNKEIASANKGLVDRDKDLLKARKEIKRVENSQRQLKLQRHEIYKQCKLAETPLPLTNGSLSAVDVGPDTDTMSGNGDLLETIIANEDVLLVDFDKLDVALKDFREVAPMNEAEKQLNEELAELEKKIRSFQAPNLRADQNWEKIQERTRQQLQEFEDLREETRQARQDFADIKKQRYDKFMECFERLSQNIDSIYKDLTQNDSAQAVLDLVNTEEPYLDGVSYHCVAPGKPFQSMSNLSGGEKTLAALALLFAIQSYEPSPFFVLDEIDAALDNTNISKVTSYIQRKSKQLQVLVISLKEDFFEEADALVGIAPNVQPSECTRSEIFTLNLTKYLNN